MRMLVLGAGLQGSACAYDLLQCPEVERVTLADLHPRRAASFLIRKKDKRLVTARLDAKSGPRLRKLMRGHDAVMNALPYYFNYPVAKAALEAGFAVHCEKPLTITLAESKDLIRLVRQTGLPFVVSAPRAPSPPQASSSARSTPAEPRAPPRWSRRSCACRGR